MIELISVQSISICAFVLIGLMYAASWLQFHLSFKTGWREAFEVIIASVFVIVLWPVMITFKLLRGD